jgi:hypothetical protein
LPSLNILDSYTKDTQTDRNSTLDAFPQQAQYTCTLALDEAQEIDTPRPRPFADPFSCGLLSVSRPESLEKKFRDYLLTDQKEPKHHLRLRPCSLLSFEMFQNPLWMSLLKQALDV